MAEQNKSNAKNNETRVSSFGAWQRARMSMPRNAPKDVDKDKEKESAEEMAREARTGMEAVPRSLLPKLLGKLRTRTNMISFNQFNEATYQGKKVSLNKPMAGDVKKSKVYVDPDGDGKAQKVNFGDKNMTIKKNIPARRRSFRARHNCDNPGPKTMARYWSCRAW